MPASELSRRDALCVATVGLASLSGCLGIFGGDNYRPGAIEVQNKSDQSHRVFVTFYRFDQELWVGRGTTPTLDNPEIPTAEPEIRRGFEFEVGPGESTIERTAITDPLCGAITMVKVELESDQQYTTHFPSMCSNTEPEGTSNIYLRITVTNSNKLDVSVLTQPPGAA